MKPSRICSPGQEGFLGYFYEAPRSAGKCIITLAGDDGNDFLSQAFARWFTRYQNMSVLSLALRQDPTQDPGIHLWNLNTVAEAVSWLKAQDCHKIGICGISMQAVIALSAAARIPEISLTIAFSPCDYVSWGFQHGTVDGHKNAEYPTEKSLLVFKGQPLPFQEAHMEKSQYVRRFYGDCRQFRELHSRGIFDHSEKSCRIPREAFIPAENIRGPLVLIGAEDDSMWNTTRYIYRMRKRLQEKEFIFPVKSFTYARGTHLLLPQRMVMDAIPLAGSLIPLLFSSGRHHVKACRDSRIHLDRQLSCYLAAW